MDQPFVKYLYLKLHKSLYALQHLSSTLIFVSSVWFHVSIALSCTGDKDGAHTILLAKPEGKNLVWNPRRKSDNIKVEFKKICCEGVRWIELVQNRGKCMARGSIKYWKYYWLKKYYIFQEAICSLQLVTAYWRDFTAHAPTEIVSGCWLACKSTTEFNFSQQIPSNLHNP